MIRALTEGERTLARSVFGQALVVEPIRIVTPPWAGFPFSRAFVPGQAFGKSWLVWPRAWASTDISADGLNRRAVLIHELVHVWQTQNGVNLLAAKIRAGDGAAAYRYWTTTAPWDGFNIEQQAMVVEHAYRQTHGETTPASRAFYRDMLCGCGLPTLYKND